jgi:hypothetical protein
MDQFESDNSDQLAGNEYLIREEWEWNRGEGTSSTNRYVR